MSERPRCCPELRCTPLHLLAEGDGPGESFVCFGKAPGIGFTYDGVAHVNDLRSCHYSPLKGLIAFQENRDDWEALKAAYWRALAALDAAAEDESHYEAKGYHDERSDMTTEAQSFACGACGGEVIVLPPDHLAFCPACGCDVMPAGACVELDPRWEWHEVHTMGSAPHRFIKGGCNHIDVVPVTRFDGETVAQLCLTCDQQLPPPPPDRPVKTPWFDGADI